MKIEFGESGANYVLIDRDRQITLELDRGAAKAVCRFLMKKLNIISAKLKTKDLQGNIIYEEIFEKDPELNEYRIYQNSKNIGS